ncbi:MAG: DMT family transporter [Pseudomonadota bacterium]
MSRDPPRNNRVGGAWLIADLSLNIWALAIVKAIGGDYPATQIVFLRAATGLLLIAPLIWRERAVFRSVPDLGLHALRVVLSLITLTASFYALPRVPLALFTAIGFTRPIVTMVLASGLLREPIGVRRWCAAAVAMAGVLIATSPGSVAWTMGLAAVGVVVLTGSGAVIVTRRLRAAPEVVMMAFYTVGLGLASAPFAAASWVPLDTAHVLPLLLVGALSQSAQLCFLRAHYHGEAGFLSVLSYLSLVLSVAVGWAVFGETPTVAFWLGAALVVGGALWVGSTERRPRPAQSGP